jgi:hypothetical protein
MQGPRRTRIALGRETAAVPVHRKDKDAFACGARSAKLVSDRPLRLVLIKSLVTTGESPRLFHMGRANRGESE